MSRRTLLKGILVALATIAVTACGGGGSAVLPPGPSGGPVLRQFATIDTQNADGTQVLRVRLPQPTLAGSALFAWSRSSIDGQTEVYASFSDDRGNTYVPTGDREADASLLVNAAQATAYAANIAAGTQEITATWGPFSDYRSIVVAEISGVSAQPFLASASNIQTVTAGTDNVRSGPFTVSAPPALIVAISSNESQVNGPPFAPSAGTGFTSVATTTSYGLVPRNDFTRLTARLTTSAGSQEALFSAPVADEYLTFAVVFR